MKAILYNQYGTEEVLYEADIAIPTIDGNEVLVEVYSTSLNHFGLAERSGVFAKDTDVFPRLSGGKDFAGVVKEIGKDRATKIFAMTGYTVLNIGFCVTMLLRLSSVWIALSGVVAIVLGYAVIVDLSESNLYTK